MSRQVTKASGNRYCQARLEAAKYNERFASRASAAEEIPGVTEDSLKKRMEFSFDEEGLNEAVAWLNAEYESRKDEWEQAGL